VVDGRTGFQVETFDNMVSKVRLLLAEPSLRQRLGEAAVTHVRQFDWNVIARRWQMRFERLCG
jgi:glycosyltransferase involved in cell wall biosynthesis